MMFYGNAVIFPHAKHKETLSRLAVVTICYGNWWKYIS